MYRDPAGAMLPRLLSESASGTRRDGMTATEVAGSAVTEVLDAIERVRPAIEAHRDEGERDRRLSVAIIEAMRDAGLLSLWTPGDYGGKEVGLLQLMTAVEGVSAIDGASGFVLAN